MFLLKKKKNLFASVALHVSLREMHCLPVCALSQVAGLLNHRLRRDMEGGSKLIAGSQPVGLVRNSLWGPSTKTNN